MNGNTLGLTFRCPVCGSEITVLTTQSGHFTPRCCNEAMVRLERRGVFFRCPVCGAEIMAAEKHVHTFTPYCCSVRMVHKAA